MLSGRRHGLLSISGRFIVRDFAKWGLDSEGNIHGCGAHLNIIFNEMLFYHLFVRVTHYFKQLIKSTPQFLIAQIRFIKVNSYFAEKGCITILHCQRRNVYNIIMNFIL